MGQLTPGATYIYERANGMIYAREHGEDTRRLIGCDFPIDKSMDRFKNDVLWDDIRQAAHTNPSLQVALDHAILLYRLSKEPVK